MDINQRHHLHASSADRRHQRFSGRVIERPSQEPDEPHHDASARYLRETPRPQHQIYSSHVFFYYYCLYTRTVFT